MDWREKLYVIMRVSMLFIGSSEHFEARVIEKGERGYIVRRD